VNPTGEDVPRFERRLFDPGRRISRIGISSLGGKARGLVTAARILDERRADLEVPGLSLDVPALCVVATSVFDAFLDRNGLRPLLEEGPSDQVVALAFQRATLPAEWLGDLRAVADDARVPLACRSSSALEDALGRPFAGVYGTKMIPGNQADVAGRFKSLVDAIKFVFATTFFHEARAYRRAARRWLAAGTATASIRTSPASPAPTTSTLSDPPSRRKASWTWPSASARRSWTAGPAGRSPPPIRSCRRRSGRCATSWTPRRRSSGRSTWARPRPTTR
jgi:hypothetical protein